MSVEITGMTKIPLSGNKTTSGITVDHNNRRAEQTENTPVIRTAISTDKITLTQQAEKLHMIEKSINDQTGYDNERIENLKLEIDAGQYDIDVQRVAEKFIAFEVQFGA